MITKHDIRETSEQLQENLLTYLDGLLLNESQEHVCQIVVDALNQLKDKAQ
jgi:hypothetical protein